MHHPNKASLSPARRRRLRDGVIDALEIKHGLPFRMIVTEVPA
jgi:hypothetical protein